MGLDREGAQKLSAEYYAKYGLTLRGLILHHDVVEEEYLSYVHDTLPYRA